MNEANKQNRSNALIACPQCAHQISPQAKTCPECGEPINLYKGFYYRSKATIGGIPFLCIAAGRDKKTGKLLVAKGIIAIGQFAVGLVTIAQFGLGFLFGFGQFIAGYTGVAQFALCIYFGAGQFATGVTAIGQFAFGKFVLAQIGFGQYIWSVKEKNPVAIEYFQDLWTAVKGIF